MITASRTAAVSPDACSPGGRPGRCCGAAVTTALADRFEQFAADLEPHEAGEGTSAGVRDKVVAPGDAVAPDEPAAAVAAARTGNRLVIEQHAAQRVDSPGVVAHPLQLGELLPHRANEPPMVRVAFQPRQSPGRQVGLRLRRADRHRALTGHAA